MNKLLMIFADGFEETEAVATYDVLHRIGFDLTTAGLESTRITGAHNMTFDADCELDRVVALDFNAVILPGGMPGAENLKNSDMVMEILNSTYRAGGFVCAICAAPMVLAKAGLLEGRNFTCFPGFEKYCIGGNYTATLIERDDRVVTAKAVGASFEFAYEIASLFGMDKQALDVLESMFVTRK